MGIHRKNSSTFFVYLKNFIVRYWGKNNQANLSIFPFPINGLQMELGENLGVYKNSSKAPANKLLHKVYKETKF